MEDDSISPTHTNATGVWQCLGQGKNQAFGFNSALQDGQFFLSPTTACTLVDRLVAHHLFRLQHFWCKLLRHLGVFVVATGCICHRMSPCLTRPLRLKQPLQNFSGVDARKKVENLVKVMPLHGETAACNGEMWCWDQLSIA